MEVKTMSTDKPRYTITLDEEMLKKIDDFRFENRFPNRTQATLELIRIGMETIEKQKKDKEIENHKNDNNEEEKTELVRIAAFDGNGVETRQYTKDEIKKAEEILKSIKFRTE